MLKLLSVALLTTFSLLQHSPVVNAFVNYDNEFVDPTYALSLIHNPTTVFAQKTILDWADQFGEQGPWSVMNKSVTPPTGDKHTYLSWAPYWWPNCTGVGNTTELTPEQIWVTCPYYQRDGMFNPDRLLVNNTGAFNAMADAILYNSLAWAITRKDLYEKRIVNFIDTWFLNPDTYMYPNLDYGQMHRGPTGQHGEPTGVLDLKCMTKVATGVLILREGLSTRWTHQMDVQLRNWTTYYIDWLTSAPIALKEGSATNNHGTYYANQLTALHIIANDKPGATAMLQNWYENDYQIQISGTGEQPEEATRTLPYHYRCYNLAAMITNIRLSQYLGVDTWKTPNSQGGTIQKACDFTMTVSPAANETADELYELVAATASIYGDPANKYANFLKKVDKSYPTQPYFFWDQPFTDGGYLLHHLGNSTEAE